MMADGCGFYLEYYGDKVCYIHLSGNSFDDVTEVYVGGDPIPIPRALFMDMNEAITQVKEFIKTVKVACNINWKDRADVNWHYGEDINAKEYKEPVCKSIEELVIKHSRVKRKWMKDYENKKR